MQLPGGLIENGVRRRDWSFRLACGALELAVAETADEARSMPEAVTRVLALALDRLAGAAPSPARVAGLCVADRQFLMRELERHLGFEGGWFQGECERCGARFDFRLEYAELPVQEAGPGYPHAEIETGAEGRRLRFRLPNGADQAILAELPEAQGHEWLLRQLADEPRASEPPPSQAVIAAVEAALEAVSPAVVLWVQTQCPECGSDSQVEIDPYQALAGGVDGLLHEVHQIAAHYHWSEGEILNLPRARRRRYLRLIDRARGMVD